MTDEVDGFADRLELTDEPRGILARSAGESGRDRCSEAGWGQHGDVVDPALVQCCEEIAPDGACLGNAVHEYLHHVVPPFPSQGAAQTKAVGGVGMLEKTPSDLTRS